MQKSNITLITLIIIMLFNCSLLIAQPFFRTKKLLTSSLAKSVKNKKITSNDVLYPEISKQFFTITESRHKNNVNNTEEHILQFCRLLLKQRYIYWQNNIQKAPLYVKLHENLQLQLPSIKLNSVGFFQSNKILGEARMNYLSYGLDGIFKLLHQLLINPETVHLFFKNMLMNAPYQIKLNAILLDHPTRLLHTLLHEITHLEQFGNALALSTYITKKYNLKPEDFCEFFMVCTNDYANKAYKTMENDELLQSLVNTSWLDPEKHDPRRSKEFSRIKTERIVEPLKSNSICGDIEAEADDQCYLFMHNPYLMDRHLEKLTFRYDPVSIKKGYDPCPSWSVKNYAKKYYRRFPERFAEHVEEYKRLKPFLHEE